MSVVPFAETVGDPESTRRVHATIVVFVVLGLAMLLLAVWLFRRTKPELRLLAPLEVMDTRRWRRSEPAQQGRELDEKRPEGARPLRRAAQRPIVDAEFGTARPVRSFDDLAVDAAEPTGSDDSVPVRSAQSDGDDPTPIGRPALEFPPVSEPPDSVGTHATDEQPLLAVVDDQGDTTADDDVDHEVRDVSSGNRVDDVDEGDGDVERIDGDVERIDGELIARPVDPSS